MGSKQPTRRADAGAVVSYTSSSGATVTLRATKRGLIHARDAEGDAVLDSMGFAEVASHEDDDEEEGTD